MTLGRNKKNEPVYGLMHDHVLLEFCVRNSIKKGKKSLALKLVNKAFESFKLRLPSEVKFQDVLDTMLSKSLIKINFVKRRSGSRTHRIPYALDFDYAMRYTIKRLCKLILKRKERGFSNKLAEELWSLYKGENSVLMAERHRLYAEAKSKLSLTYMISRFKFKEPSRLRISSSFLKD